MMGEMSPRLTGLLRLTGHAAALGLGAWLLADTSPPGSEVQPADPGTSLSVVVPARDEAGSLPALLTSLAAQTRPATEVIVVDDHSSDATAEVAARHGAVVVAAPELPAGWLGKPWACHTGAHAASGTLLCFLDADVRLAPDALARLVAEYHRAGGMVTVQPSHRPVRAYEQLSAVCNVVEMMGTGGFTGRPHRAMTLAFGPCLLLDRCDYERSGGHAHPSVRTQVCEDAALAARLRAEGGEVRAFAGCSTVTFRMYPDGPAQLVQGWSKMLAGGMRRSPRVPALLTAVWVGGALLGARRGLAALNGARRGTPSLADATVYLAWAAQMRLLTGRVGRWHPLAAWAFPGPLLAFVALSARAGALAVSGRPAKWRGRPVPAG